METIDSSDTSQCWNIGSAVHFQGMLLFDLRSGDLVADDFYDNTIEVCTGNVNVYTGKGLAYELEELSFYAQPLDHSSLRPPVSVSFSPGIASYDTTYRTITGNQTGTTTTTISRAISGVTYQVSLSLTVCESKQVYIYYDNATMNSTWAGYTTEVVDFLQRSFSETVGVFYYLNSTPQTFTYSQMHNCAGGYTTSCYNTCGTSCLNHHKNLYYWRTQIRGGTTNDPSKLYMYWRNGSADVFCFSNTNACEQLVDNPLALVEGYQNTAFFLQCPETSSSNVKAAMCIVGAHETAHTLGLREVRENEYGDIPEDTPHDIAYGWKCVMEAYEYDNVYDFYRNVYLGYQPAFCPYCINKLSAHVQLTLG